jgi:hypothetical protein
VPASRLAEDIPLARRSQPAAPRRVSPVRRLGWLLLACGLFSGSAVLLARGPLRSVLTPPPVAGLNARLSSDGRLLGHFPYPEAAPANLVSFAPGQQLHRDAAAALGAMQQGAADRYFQEATANVDKFVPEGIEGRVPYKGSVLAVIHQLIGGLRSSMGYLGCASIPQMHDHACFVEITSAGVSESHVHDVQITKEAPNYHID